jgi:beta-mannanase
MKWGMYVTNIPWDDAMTNIRTVDTEMGRHSGIVHWYAQWGDPGPGVFSYNQPRLLNNVQTYSSMGTTGSTPLITWEPWGPNHTAGLADFPLAAIAAGQYDAYIDSWAAGLRAVGYRVFLDFAHEMNGNWYPWGYGVNGNTPDQYIAAFRHVHDRFALAGANNVKFVWNPDQWSPSGISTTAFYPGDAYVDWMAIDAYNWNVNWGTPEQVIGPVYNQIAPLNGKPIMLAEIGSQANPPFGANPPTQAAWITAMAQSLPASFPRIQAMVWFNDVNTAFALDYSAAELAAARTAFGGC